VFQQHASVVSLSKGRATRSTSHDDRKTWPCLKSTANNNNDDDDDQDSNTWSITDDWNQLSDQENGPTSSDNVWQKDIVGRAAFFMEQGSASTEWNGDIFGAAKDDDEHVNEHWRMQEAMEKIHQYPSSLKDDKKKGTPVSALLFDEDDEETPSNTDVPPSSFFDEEIMYQEIAQLIRCNQDPQQLLIDQGRAIPPLTVQQKYNVRQLVHVVLVEEDSTSTAVRYEATAFLQDTVRAIFLQHAIPQRQSKQEAAAGAKEESSDTTNSHNDKRNTTDGMILDSSGVASWYQRCLNISPSRCGPHDARVQQIISRFGQYGKGCLTYDNLLALYLQAVVGKSLPGKNLLAQDQTVPSADTWYDMLILSRRTEIEQVWRDFERHGIESPNTVAWQQQVQSMEEQIAAAKAALGDVNNGGSSPSTLFHDECEILEHGTDAERKGEYWIQDPTNGSWQRTGKSSHERVEVCTTDPTVAARMTDGEFVYIDEESCIGCTQCVVTAPSNFCMLEQNGGRARTFNQDNTPDVAAAVATCPVNCMHWVGLERLVELERARDDESVLQSKNDHFRHFGTRQQQGRQQRPAGTSQTNGDNDCSCSSNGNVATHAGGGSSSSSSSSASQWIAHTPLHVSRMESSDANHKESIYHFFRNQCYKSSACPQKGCYDCPMYASNPESNPHWQRKKARQTHLRAHHFLNTGAADGFRKKADL